jgi:small subunit ribosomal protein S4
MEANVRYTGPKVRLSRRAGVPLARKAVGYFERRPYPPGEHGRDTSRRNTGDYGLRLLEKQKLRWYYDVSERQLRRYWDLAVRKPGASGAELAYIAVDHADLRFTLVNRPERDQIVVPVDEQLVVEFYSR